MNKEPGLIYGKDHVDQRGTIAFVNEFNMEPVKRFYLIEPSGHGIVRAWQGHKVEQKWFYTISGSFQIVVVQPDVWTDLSGNIAPQEFVLSARSGDVLHVPGGYANGFRALEPGSKVMVFSDLTMEHSSQDDYRFDQNLWYDWDKK